MKDLPIQPGLLIPARELEVLVARSGGPGGQNVNKVSSKVTIKWALHESQVLSPFVADRLRKLAGSRLNDDGTIQITSQEHRDQPANYQACATKLRLLILQALHPPKIRKATRPTLGSKQRRLNDKSITSQRKAGRRNSGWE